MLRAAFDKMAEINITKPKSFKYNRIVFDMILEAGIHQTENIYCRNRIMILIATSAEDYL